MLIAIVGDGRLAEVLARAAAHAGHTIVWTRDGDRSHAAHDADLVIVAGSHITSADLETVTDVAAEHSAVVVDAAEHSIFSQLRGTARVVRAFASVPADALAAATAAPASDGLGVPIAGDDVKSKAIIASLMHSMGVEAFDVGALAVADTLEPGGLLWNRALTPVELLEEVGELSGGG